jgi:hypothetical protein
VNPDLNKLKEEKPPIGIKPREIHDQERALEVSAAVHRYIAANRRVPREWLLELCDLYGSE